MRPYLDLKLSGLNKVRNQQNIFFNLGKRNYARKTLSQVKLDNEEITSDRVKVNKQIETFF